MDIAISSPLGVSSDLYEGYQSPSETKPSILPHLLFPSTANQESISPTPCKESLHPKQLWFGLAEAHCLPSAVGKHLGFLFLRPAVAETHPQASDFIPISSAMHRRTVQCVHPAF